MEQTNQKVFRFFYSFKETHFVIVILLDSWLSILEETIVL